MARGLGAGPDRVEVVAVHEGEPLPEPETLLGVVVSGSPAMVTERADWSESAGRWLADIVEQDALPVLGLCYGHQLIAQALGGEVGPNPRGREMGTVEVTLAGSEVDGDPLFEAGSHPAHMTHVESVLRPPDGARVLGRSALETHAALRFGPRQWGVQFHPEFDREIMCSYIEFRRDILLAEGFDPDGMLAATRETPVLSGLLARFARLADGG
jgi:GMP synthase (glutamine-hydrolysing)